MTKKIATSAGWLMFLILIISLIIGAILPPPFGNIFCFIVYSVWLYSLGKEAQSLNQQEIAIPLNRLIYSLLFSLTYAVIAEIYWNIIMPYAAPFHLLAIGCLFYVFYFIAKSIRNVELKRSTSFEEWAALAVGVWFFPVGVWFLQKRMRKIS